MALAHSSPWGIGRREAESLPAATADGDRLVYHGTDEASAVDITTRGLDRNAWRQAAGGAGVDPKGFSMTTDRAVAQAWAKFRAAERGGRPVVLQAPAALPLRQGTGDDLADPDELFIAPRDFPLVGPGVLTPSP